MIDDEAIKALVTRLSRQHGSGGRVIERAAILAEGADSSSILAWILAHDGEPEALAAAGAAAGGLHGGPRSSSGGTDASPPRRYVLPPGALQ